MLATKLRSFEEAFDLLNARFFENALSKSVITIYPTPGAYGHFTPWKSWEGAGGAGYCEINLGAATVNRPVIESIATLVHEMTHADDSHPRRPRPPRFSAPCRCR